MVADTLTRVQAALKLWLLGIRPEVYTEHPGEHPWAHPWGTAQGFVVRADDEAQARRLADSYAGGETDEWHTPAHPWLDPTYTTCVELTGDGPAEVILRDFLED